MPRAYNYWYSIRNGSPAPTNSGCVPVILSNDSGLHHTCVDDSIELLPSISSVLSVMTGALCMHT